MERSEIPETTDNPWKYILFVVSGMERSGFPETIDIVLVLT